ncbi:hypothetical protein GCM10010301_73210 [Streptomyces plicatus]|nr:hypothetical protein GCM10010301_73210 [Streptomyces plicatus]
MLGPHDEEREATIVDTNGALLSTNGATIVNTNGALMLTLMEPPL